VQVRESRSGLLLAEETAAPRDIREQLKRIDPDLILGQEVDSAWSCFVWKVLLRQADRPAIWLFDWREDNGRPLPLSSGLVDEAWAMRKGSRRQNVEDPLAVNDAMVERQDKEDTEETLGISAEVYKRSRILSPIHRSRGLYLSRARARREGR
jgi:hypothetical protein